MSPSNPNSSVLDRLSATTVLTGSQAAVIRQTYALFGVAVIAAMVGGYVGATTESIVRFFSTWMGWIVAMIGLNAVPRIAMSARGNPALGTAALVFDGFFAGICLAPLLWFASLKAPVMIVAALGITAIVFLAITGYIFLSGRAFGFYAAAPLITARADARVVFFRHRRDDSQQLSEYRIFGHPDRGGNRRGGRDCADLVDQRDFAERRCG